MNTATRPIISAPNNEDRLLLHSCCAPCEGEVLETLLNSSIQPTVFFYNPNIHPKKEYEIRKKEDKKFCDKLGVKHIDVDYDVRNCSTAVLLDLEQKLKNRIQGADNRYLLHNSYVNMLKHLDEKFDKQSSKTIQRLEELDKRRELNYKNVFDIDKYL